MLLGIIKDETNNIEYYINSETKDNVSEIAFTMVSTNDVKTLSKEEIIKLLKTILSSKLTFKEKYNDYDVYLDESNNKRYFKNGRENYFMFLENNGVSALNYLEKIDKHSKPKSKRYSIVASTIVFDVILSASVLIPFAGDVRIRENIDKGLSYVVSVSSNEMINSIQSSKYLTDEEKDILCNKDYFDFVLKYSDSNRNYNLRQSLDNLQIKYYPYEEGSVADGYQDPLEPNTIYILETHADDEKLRNEILIHEFIHTTQNHNVYSYIKEASDEIFKNEFYGKDIIAYMENVKRVKVLMEIIGPEPIAYCNFESDPQRFRNAINEYLTPEEANELLYLFTTPATLVNDPEYDLEDLNNKIDSYLAIMYHNKTGKDIHEDAMINSIYNRDVKNRIYFNSNLDSYYQDYYKGTCEENIGKIKMNDALNSYDIELFDYQYEETIIRDGVEYSHIKAIETTDFSEVPQEDDSISLKIVFADGTLGYTRYNSETNSWNDVSHIRILNPYEPPIYKKFPEQDLFVKPYNNKNIEEKYKKIENEESEAKYI